MKRPGLKRLLPMALICLNLAFIWGNSALPAGASNQVSGAVMQILGDLLHVAPSEGAAGMHLLRKLAHFTEFLLLGLNFCWLFLRLGKTGIHQAAMSLLCGILAACIDEIIQIFSPGRNASLVDVCIDMGGLMIGIAILLLGHSILTLRKRKQNTILEDNQI